MATNSDFGNDFDPTKLALNIINTVAAFKSNCGPAPETLVLSPEQVGVGAQAENSLNCFFRLLGMPATRDESKISTSDKNAIKGGNDVLAFYISQSQSINYFSQSSIGSAFGSLTEIFEKRNSQLNSKQTPEQYAEMISNPLAAATSILDSHRRAKIIPPIVDASIPVFPLSKRMAPLFNDGDALTPDGKRRLSRPFLEHIIYMRTKVFSGVQSNLVAEISELIEAHTGDAELAAKLPTQFTQIERAIVEKFLQAMRQSAEKYAAVIAKAKKISSEVSFQIAPTNNPEQRSITPLSGNPAVGVSVTSLGTKIAKLNEELAKERSFMIALPTESVNRSDRIKRLEDEVVLNNVVADVFVSDFVDLLGVERKNLESELEKAKDEERAKIMELEQVKRDLMLYSGEFTGLSIFDILATLYALFTIETKYLVGLLNDGAKTRLKADEFFKTNVSSATTDQSNTSADLLDATANVRDSMQVLVAQIETGFKLINFFESEASSSG